ncbi:hypothetical protein YB2330_004171 [Saitoella coloradoensis]
MAPGVTATTTTTAVEEAVVRDRKTALPSQISAVGRGDAAGKLKLPTYPTFATKEEERTYVKEHMAAAFRWMGKSGYGLEGVAGHISIRDPILRDHFWLNPLAKHFSLMRTSDLVLVDHSGNVSPHGNQAIINAAAFAIHSEIHRARPDVDAACHAHSVHGKAFAALGRELDIITQDSCHFWKDQAVYDNFGGVVLAKEEGERVAAALGNNRLCILQNHGLLTVGKTVDEAAFLFGAADRCCQAQLLADAAAGGRGGQTVKIGEEEAKLTHGQLTQGDVLWLEFQPSYELMEYESKGDFKN